MENETTEQKANKLGFKIGDYCLETKLNEYVGKIESFVGATGAKFSLLPPDNATGNFIKVTQRIPVRIAITEYPKDKADLLFPGLSAFVKVSIK